MLGYIVLVCAFLVYVLVLAALFLPPYAAALLVLFLSTLGVIVGFGRSAAGARLPPIPAAPPAPPPLVPRRFDVGPIRYARVPTTNRLTS